MALKDWKKVKSNFLFDYYEHVGGGSAGHITVSNKYSDGIVMGNNKKEGYVVSAFRSGKGMRYVAGTKSQAHTRARAYMRSH